MALSSSRSRCVSLCGDRPQSPPWLAAAALAAVLALLAGCAKPEAPAAEATPAAGNDATTASSGSCAAPAAWFPHDKTPEPNPNHPFESFCAFHQWAWQSFLWLTQQPDGQTLRFQAFPTLEDVITGKDTSQTRGTMKLAVRTQKADGPNQSLDEVAQADSLGVLVDHGGRAVYYAQYVNPLMFNQIVSLQWNQPEILQKIPPDTEFQTGNVELKASWKIVAPGEDTSGYYVQPALIDRLVAAPDGNVQVDESKPPLEVKVALVGLHVVGWVQGHPEAIWATFEHDNNAPDLAHNQSPSAPVSDRNWTFYSANTLALDCNQIDTGNLKLDPATQTLKPVTQACRQFPFGMAAGTPSSDPNLQAITQLNASVKSQLGNDVAKNYFEVGAIWLNPVDLQPNSTLQANLTGSTLLNSSVIETFTQNVQGQNNCFGCHNTMMYNPTDPSIPPLQGTNINLSHVILEAYVANQPKKKETR